MAATTTTYSFNLPTVNSATDEDLWGGQLNTNWTVLDALMDLREQNLNFADFELQRPELKDYAETIEESIASSSAVAVVDFENGNHAEIDLTEDVTTLTISNPPASGKVGMMMIDFKQDGTGGWAVTFPSAIKWAGGTAPTITTTANRTDTVTIRTKDGGTTYQGFVSGQDFTGV